MDVELAIVVCVRKYVLPTRMPGHGEDCGSDAVDVGDQFSRACIPQTHFPINARCYQYDAVVRPRCSGDIACVAIFVHSCTFARLGWRLPAKDSV